VTEYLATGRAAHGRVGGASSELIDAADLVAFAVDWMVANLSPRGPGGGNTTWSTG
jgi:aminoglycoside N3'-acetyltransferase